VPTSHARLVSGACRRYSGTYVIGSSAPSGANERFTGHMGYVVLILWVLGFVFFFQAASKGAKLLPEPMRPPVPAMFCAAILWPWLVIFALAKGDL